jgi:hypothetical protein
MTVTREQIITALLPDEPRYDAGARLGPEPLPHLSALVRGDDPNLANASS